MRFLFLFLFLLSGATLGRGLNRGLATLTAGGLGIGAHYLADLPGRTGQPILLGLFVFILGKFQIFLFHQFLTNQTAI